MDRTGRRQGIGSALMAALAAWGRRHGMGSIQLGANVLRSKAHRVYAALGFKEAKRQVLFARPIDRPA